MVYFALANLSSRARIWAHQLFNITAWPFWLVTACPILRKLAFPNTNTTLPKGHLTFCLLEKTFLLSAQLLLSVTALCNADFSPVSLHQFNTELQRCLTYCGLDLSRYKSHSFRIGGACHAADNGFSDAQIRALGRWKSDAFKVYLRSEILTTNW